MRVQSLIDQSREYDRSKFDTVYVAQDFAFDDQMNIDVRQLTLGETEADGSTLTEWAAWQACQKYGMPYAYFKKCPTWLRAVNLNHWHEQSPNRRLLLRSDGKMIRGYLSSRYCPIDNTWLLDTVDDLLNDVTYNVVGSYVTPDELHLKLSMADTVANNYAVGVYVGNGEIGNYKVRVRPFIQVHACENSIIFLEDGWEAFHIGVTITTMRVYLKEALGRALQAAPDMIDQMIASEEANLPNLSFIVETICDKYNLSPEIHDDILLGTHGKETAAGLAAGLSWAAQKVADIRTRIDMETTAGSAITNPYEFSVVVSEEEVV